MSSTYNDVRSAIENRINTEMALAPVISVSYQNVPFSSSDNSSWVQVFIRFGDNNYATLLSTGAAGGFNRQTGVLVVNIFTPTGIGTSANFAIAERIKNKFDRAKFSGIIFDAATGPVQVDAGIIETGVSASSALAAAFFQTQLTASFEAYLD